MVKARNLHPACGKEGCTFPTLFSALGRTHVMDILFILTHEGGRPVRFSALERRLGLHPKVLTETLREMEAFGLVTRESRGGFPPRIVYAVPEHWLEMGESIERLHQLWEEAQDQGLVPPRAASVPSKVDHPPAATSRPRRSPGRERS